MCPLLKKDVLSCAKTYLPQKNRAINLQNESSNLPANLLGNRVFAPVLKITHVENPKLEISLILDLLCQDGFLDHYCISPFQQFLHLRCAVMPCTVSNQEDPPSKWSNCGRKGSVIGAISTRILISIFHSLMNFQ